MEKVESAWLRKGNNELQERRASITSKATAITAPASRVSSSAAIRSDRWPVFRLLDRISCVESVPLDGGVRIAV